MKSINKVSFMALGSLTTFSCIAIFSYWIKDSKEQKTTKVPLTAYEDCIQNSKTIPEKNKLDVCEWLYKKTNR